MQTDEEIKKEFKDRYEKSEIYNPIYVDWFPDDVMNWWLRKFHTLQEEYKEKEICICAAIRMDDGYIIKGHRHSDAIHTMKGIPRYKDSWASGSNQGFVTSKNRFVNRIEGAKLQKEAGIKSKMPEGQEYLHGELYSEDLY